MPLLMVLCTFPDEETARSIATAVVQAELAACVSLVPSVQSIYRWEGKMESAEEVLALMKTTAEAYPGLEAQLKELHPYDVPEIVAVPIERVEERYAKWVGEMTEKSGR